MMPKQEIKTPETPAADYVCVLAPCARLRRIPHIGAFLPEARELKGGAAMFDAVADWASCPAQARPRTQADTRGVPFIAVEDGLLHAFSPDSPPLSLLVDQTGACNDGSGPSDIENLLLHAVFDPGLLRRAETAMAWIRHERFGKYATGHAPYDGPAKFRRVIAGDADGESAEKMIADALAGCRLADIAVMSRGPALRDAARRQGIALINPDANPWDVIDRVEEVYTVADRLGFEALMANKKVHCYGTPFYAGWGVTEDPVKCARRVRKRGTAEIFAAAYILHARYVDPFTGKPATLEDTIALLSDLCRRKRRALKDVYALGFGPWKWPFIRNFTGGKVRFRFWVTRRMAKKKGVLAWSSRIPRLILRKQLPAGIPFARMEDGFVRSRGLGAHRIRPWSLVVDTRGIYYDPRTPSDLEHILETETMPEGLLQRAARLRRMLVENSISKYNTGAEGTPRVDAGGKRVILVPGQVEDDASIKTGTTDIRTNFDLLKAVRDENPDAFVIYKPHPDVENAGREGAVPDEDAREYCDLILRGGSIASLWPIVDELHTMTSLSGFEALLREKKVVVYGMPFYAGWGVTEDKCAFPRRTRRRTLDELVAATLILYPVYFDWRTLQPCNVETVIGRLAEK